MNRLEEASLSLENQEGVPHCNVYRCTGIWYVFTLVVCVYSSDPSIVPIDCCRLPAIVPVNSLGTGGINQCDTARGVVPISAIYNIVLVLLPAAYQHYGETTINSIPITAVRRQQQQGSSR